MNVGTRERESVPLFGAMSGVVSFSSAHRDSSSGSVTVMVNRTVSNSKAATVDSSTLANPSEIDEVPPTETELSHQAITQETATKGQRLVLSVTNLNQKLQVLESSTLPAGTAIMITPSGVLGCARHSHDGCFHFGSAQDTSNDFSFPIGEGCGPRHFSVQYSVAKNSYYVRDTKQGNGTFVRLDHPFVLREVEITLAEHTGADHDLARRPLAHGAP